MPSPRRRTRISLSIRVDRELAARVREFCRCEAGKPLFCTMSSFTEGAFEAHLLALARQLDDGSRERPPSRNYTHR